MAIPTALAHALNMKLNLFTGITQNVKYFRAYLHYTSTENDNLDLKITNDKFE